MPEKITLPNPTKFVLAQHALALNLILRIRHGPHRIPEDLLRRSNPIDSLEGASTGVADDMCNIRVSIDVGKSQSTQEGNEHRGTRAL